MDFDTFNFSFNAHAITLKEKKLLNWGRGKNSYLAFVVLNNKGKGAALASQSPHQCFTVTLVGDSRHQGINPMMREPPKGDFFEAEQFSL